MANAIETALVDFAAAFGLMRSRAGVGAEVATADSVTAAAGSALAAADDIAAVRLNGVQIGLLMFFLAVVFSILRFRHLRSSYS
jgi:hypothetical protein